MNILKQLACAATLALSVAGAANAAVLNNWVVNPNGGGYAAGQFVNEYLDLNGNAFLQIRPTGGAAYTFTEHAVFNLVQADSNGMLFPINFPGGTLTGTLEATGTGNFSGASTYTGGTLRLYQNPNSGQYATTAGYYGANLGKEIGAFALMEGGGGNVDAYGSPIPNDQIIVLAKAVPGDLDAGYFFRENGDDLSMESVILGFAFTNAITISAPQPVMVNGIACRFAGFTGDGCNGEAFTNTPGAFFTSINGTLKLAEVPEPGSLALFGIALLGAGLVRRKAAKRA